MKWLLFSRNRPYQLDASIRTANVNAGIAKSDINILYRYDHDYDDCLVRLKNEHSDCHFIEETNFREQVLDWVKKQEGIISFATDDSLFTRNIRKSVIFEILKSNPHVLTFSLRLGLHLEHFYPTNSKQPIPNGKIQSEIFTWDFNYAAGDWAYPLSVDGHAFRKSDIETMLENIDFKSPNTLESNLQIFKGSANRAVCSFINSCYFNSPLNKVQTDFDNRSSSLPLSVLNDAYRGLKRFDPQWVENFYNISAHQEVNLLL